MQNRQVRSVLLCGASVRSLAESAIAAGLRPLCIDFFQDVDLQDLLNGRQGRFLGTIERFEELPRYLHGVPTSVPLLWSGGLENNPDVLRQIAARRPLVGIDPAVVEQFRRPDFLKNCLASAGFRIPKLRRPGNAVSEHHESSPTDESTRWLLKSANSAGGLGVRWSDSTFQHSNNRLMPDVANMPTAAPCSSSATQTSESGIREFEQEFIDGVPMSAMICEDDHGIHLIGLTLQLIGWSGPGAGDFRFCGNAGPVFGSEPLREKLLHAASLIVENAREILREDRRSDFHQADSHRHGVHSDTPVGIFGIDFILRKGEPWFLEINPRITASHMIYESAGDRHGLNLVKRQLEAHGWRVPISRRRNRNPPDAFDRSIRARLILWSSQDRVISSDLRQLNMSSHRRPRIADIPAPQTRVSAGHPLCSVQFKSETEADLVRDIAMCGEIPAIAELFDATTTCDEMSRLFASFRSHIQSGDPGLSSRIS